MGSNEKLEKFPEKFCSLCLDALKHNPVYFVPLFGQDVILLFFFFFLSKRSTKNNILVRSSLTRVSLFALWPPHLIPGGAGWVFFFLFWHPSGSRWLVVTVAQKTNKKNGRSHYCRHFFLFRDSLYIFSSLQGKLEPSVPLSLDCRFSIFASLGPEIKSKSHLF